MDHKSPNWTDIITWQFETAAGIRLNQCSSVHLGTGGLPNGPELVLSKILLNSIESSVHIHFVPVIYRYHMQSSAEGIFEAKVSTVQKMKRKRTLRCTYQTEAQPSSCVVFRRTFCGGKTSYPWTEIARVLCTCPICNVIPVLFLYFLWEFLICKLYPFSNFI